MLPLVGLGPPAGGVSVAADRAAVRHADGNGSFGVQLLADAGGPRQDPRERQGIVGHLVPGSVLRRRMLVQNMSARPLHIDVYAGAADIVANRFTPADGAMPNELTGWIAFDQRSVDLPPYSRAPVRITVAVPPSASQAERYAVIWAQTAVPPDRHHAVGVINRVGIRAYLDIGPGGEPSPDFRIDALTPVRAGDGRPVVTARVRNTGGRALDMRGSLSLADGPARLNAGPFPAAPGVTVAPGDSASVTVPLDKHVPAGPWRARLTLASGMVSKTVTATITFPAAAATSGVPVSLGTGRLTRNLIFVGAPAVLAALLLQFAIRCRHRRTALR